MLRPRFAVLLVTASIAFASPCEAQGKNLLFYGNSYSSRNGSVANMVQQIATQAGHPAPTIVKRLAGGQNLDHHATNSGQIAAISNSLPGNQTWDFVVMQGQSLEATQTLGNPTLFRTSAQNIASNVRSHSPAAKAVLYQTWARSLGHHFYPATFASPTPMHNQIRDNYRLATDDINALFGPGAACNAAVGDGVALLEWMPSFYEPDLFHPAPMMTLLAGMTLYTSIYQEQACNIPVSFGQGGPLVSWLAGLGLDENGWHAMAAIADRCADPSLRAFPGSGDNLLLETGTLPGRVDACANIPISRGQMLVLRLSSLNGAYDLSSSLLLCNVYPNGLPPLPSITWPELQIDTGSMLVLSSVTNLATPHNFLVGLPFSFPGVSVLVQGLAWGPSNETGNVNFTTTDAHVLEFQ